MNPNQPNSLNNTLTVAGQVTAECSCCQPSQLLVHHVALGAVRMVCPATRHTYLDRGDGMFQPDGETLAPNAMAATAPPPQVLTAQATPVLQTSPLAQDLLGDRPARTADKVRISLEKATFAGRPS